jgi:multidrug efflux pump subunit AcrB
MSSIKKGLKEFGLTSLSVKNATTVVVLTVILAITGITSYKQMPAEAFPEVIIPEIYVGTAYPGNSPLDMEKLVTRPLEKEINSITGIDDIISTSTQGYSAIQVKFDFSVTPEEALRKVKDAVDKVKGEPTFPKDLPAEPNVFEMNFSELMPVMNVNLSGDFSMDLLKDYAEQLEDRIEDLPQITKVDIRGIQEKEVKVNINVHKMEAMEISFNDIEGAIANENMTISGGDVVVDGIKRNVRVVGEFEHWEQIKNIIVKQEKFNIVYLRDIAEVVFEPKERNSYAREYGAPVVMLDVIKRAGENLIEASAAINDIIDEMKETEFPENLNISITSDQSKQTKTQVDELENSIIFGTILVVGVLLFFLGLRNAVFVGIAIPLSMGIAMFILNAMGVTLNTMVLFSLVLALGMLVDNGIVIVENIYRLMGEGYKPMEAARFGAGEVAWAIIASTATTLAAFIPLAIWPGIMGEFMKYLPITLMIVLGSSLFVALVINPVLIGLLAKMTTKQVRVTAIILASFGLLFTLGGVASAGNMLIATGIFVLINPKVFGPVTDKFQWSLLPKLENIYRNTLKIALRYSRGFLFGTIGMLVVSFILMGILPPKVEFFPVNQPNYLNIFIEQPIGTDIEETNEISKEVEKRLKAFFDEDITLDNGETIRRGEIIESIIGQVGNGTSDPNQGPSMGNTPEKARIQVSFKPYHERLGVVTSEVMNEVREELSGLPGVYLTVDKDAAGPPMGKPINIEIIGEDYDKIIVESEKMLAFIKSKKVPGVEELKMDIQLGKPELVINVDEQKARRLNISTGQIGMTIRTALFGKEVSKYKQGEDEYDITIRMDESSRNNVENLMNQLITFRDMLTGQIRQVPISAIASVEKSTTISAVKRKNLKRLITLQSNVIEGYNPNEVVESIKSNLKNYKVANGLTWKFTGQQEEQAKEMSFLSTALIIAVFMIFLIIVAQFNSISAPVIIVGAVVLSLIGVLLGLVITGMDFIIIMTMIGIISLAGVVVNNAIVLIDYTKLIIERKQLEQGLSGKGSDRLPMSQVYNAIVEGGSTRLRPVLLTAITTVLGLLPLAVGLNIDFFSFFASGDPNITVGGDNVIFWGPMSWTIIFGLTFATFLTLIIVPVMYYLSLRLKYRILKAPME